MLLREVMDAWELIDRPDASGEIIRSYFAREFSPVFQPVVTTEKHDNGQTDIVEWQIDGTAGLSAGGNAPTLAITGRLGGVGVRPSVPGMVSDADGAIVAVAVALKLARAAKLGDGCKGDVKIVTHICPNAPTKDYPVKGQMQSPVPIDVLLKYETPAADALLSVDTTRGHAIINHTGFAITSTLVNGYLMRVSDDLLQIMSDVTNELPVVLPISMQDITPYGTGVYHINSIMQPGQLFDGPVVGVATVARSRVFGRATSVNVPSTLETTSRFCVEVARQYGEGNVQFFDPEQYKLLVELYGEMGFLVGRK
jgi:hypothetical protein